MVNIERKIQKKINSIIELTGEYPKEINISEAEYQELKKSDLLINNTYLKVKLNIKN